MDGAGLRTYVARPCMISRMSPAASDGVLPTLTPAASRASFLARTRFGEGLRLERVPDPATFVLFGATGDLAHRKVIPALYHLWRTLRCRTTS